MAQIIDNPESFEREMRNSPFVKMVAMETRPTYMNSYMQYESSADEVHELRLDLLRAENDLLLKKDELAYAEARISLAITGKNEAERKANAIIAAQDDEEYQSALTQARAAEYFTRSKAADLDRAQARLRGHGWLARAAMGIQNTSVAND